MAEKRYEYKCPKCGGVNIRHEECARIVCDYCKEEFIPADLSKNNQYPRIEIKPLHFDSSPPADDNGDFIQYYTPKTDWGTTVMYPYLYKELDSIK